MTADVGCENVLCVTLSMEAALAKFTDPEYHLLDQFIKIALRRVEAGAMTADDAHGDVLHVVTAFDRGIAAQFIPYMTMRMKEWDAGDV